MKIIYFGTSEFAVPALRAMAEHVCLVISQPDRPKGRGMKLQPSLVKKAAIELGLKVETPEKCRTPEFISRIAELDPDFLLVAAYGQIMPLKLLETAKQGGINLHGSTLPKYRGAAPIQRAILEGEHETGITLMQMDQGMDTGDIIAIRKTPIAPEETYGELSERLAQLGAELALEWLPKLAQGNYPRTPQNPEEATHAPKIKKEEAEICFDKDAKDEYNRFRAFTPTPGVYLHTKHGLLKLSNVKWGNAKAAPGTIISIKPELEIAFNRGSLKLLELQPEGKRRMSGRDWANGLRLKIGDSLIPDPLIVQ